MSAKKMTPRRFVRIMSIILGVVLVWRGIWYVLDGVEKYFFGGSTLVSALVGICLGIFVLYVPDRDLKEIEKL